MAKAPHRRYLHWPAPWRRAHLAAIILLPLLLATGMALYWPPVHTAMIPYLRAVYDLHIVLGAVWLGLVLWPVVLPPRFAGRRTLSAVDWLPLLALGLAAAATGVVLVLPLVFSALWRSVEFFGHGLFAAALAAAVVGHAVLRMRRTVVRATRFDPERRAFLRYAAYGLVAAVVLPWADRLPGLLAGGPTAMAAGPQGVEGQFVTYSVTNTIPQIPRSTYRLEVTGGVDAPYTLSYDELLAMPRVSVVRNFQCVTGWVVPSVRWTGVRLSDLVLRAGAKAGYDVAQFLSADGTYTDTLSGSEIDLSDVLLAYEIDGAPLSDDRGGPVRLVVPEMYGYKSVKWVHSIRMAAKVQPGYWEARGYAIDAWIGTPPPPPPCGYRAGPGPCN